MPCPFGSGAHPYLTVGTPTVDTVILRAPGTIVLQSDERGLPMGQVFVDGTEYDFRRPRALGSMKLDNAFTGLERDADGLARVALRRPDRDEGLTLWVDEGYPYLMLFSGDTLPDVNRRSLAVEPMTCPPNAFRTSESLIRIEPGASFTCSWGIAPTADGQAAADVRDGHGDRGRCAWRLAHGTASSSWGRASAASLPPSSCDGLPVAVTLDRPDESPPLPAVAVPGGDRHSLAG